MQEVSAKKNGHNIKTNGKLDIATIAGLTKWVGGAVGIIGRARTETVLDFAELTGHLPVEVKNTLVKFINRVPENGNGNGNGHSNGNGYKAFQLVMSLIELEGLIGMDNQSDELTLLAMVCQEVDQ